MGGDDQLRLRVVLGAAAGRRGGLAAQVPAPAAALLAHQAQHGQCSYTPTLPIRPYHHFLYIFSGTHNFITEDDRKLVRLRDCWPSHHRQNLVGDLGNLRRNFTGPN